MIGKWLDQPSGCTVYPLHGINNSCQLCYVQTHTHKHTLKPRSATVNTPELKSSNIIHMTVHVNCVEEECCKQNSSWDWTDYCLQGEMMLLLTIEPFLRKVMRDNCPVKSDYYGTLGAFASAYCAKSL